MKNLLILLLLTLSSSLFKVCEAQYTILHNFNDTGSTGNANGAYPIENLEAIKAFNSLTFVVSGMSKYSSPHS